MFNYAGNVMNSTPFTLRILVVGSANDSHVINRSRELAACGADVTLLSYESPDQQIDAIRVVTPSLFKSATGGAFSGLLRLLKMWQRLIS